MFGYIRADNDNLYVKDFFLYQSVYCGLCQNLKKYYGNTARFSLTYDSVFLSLFLHNYLNTDYIIQKKRCVLHMIRARKMAKPNEIDKIVVAVNLLLVKYKLKDDYLDSKKGKIATIALNGAFKKATKEYPNLDRIISNGYDKLLELENQNSDIVDKVSDCFASILVQVIQEVLQENFNEDIKLMAYHLGKWIYLIDALDDLESDYKKKNYNVFLSRFGNFDEKFISNYLDEMKYYLEVSANFVASYIKKIKFAFNADIIYNISTSGLKLKLNQVVKKKERK